MTLKTRQIGKTNIHVTDISFGCASIGNLYREVPDQTVTKLLQTAWDAGIRYFDTAPHYGRGLSETRLGDFLKTKKRDDYVISTKVGRVLEPGEAMAEADGFINPLPNKVHYDYSGDGMEAALEGSKQRLGTNFIDIAFVHDIGTYQHGADNKAHFEDFLASGYERLIRLKEQGKIGAFGLGVNETQICLDVMKHGPIDVILLAGRLTLLDRSAEEGLVEACQKDSTSLVLGGIFNSGVLATGPKPGATYDYAPASAEILAQVEALQTKAAGLGISLATSALHFARRHPSTASLLLGTAKVSSLLRNMDALNESIPAEFDSCFR